MENIENLVPGWRIENVSLRPFPGFYSFNPSVSYDGESWRMVMRNADYCAPFGVVKANMAKGGRCTTRNVIVELDSVTFKPIGAAEMLERDGLKKYQASCMGYEDMRLFWTVKDGPMGIATTMQLSDTPKQEIVTCRFDESWGIVDVRPIRGAWSEAPQKNWVPYEGVLSPRFLYSIERGLLFSEDGPIDLDMGSERKPSTEPAAKTPAVQRTAQQAPPRPPNPTVKYNGSVETRLSPRLSSPIVPDTGMATRLTARPIKYDWSSPGLRGSSQLVEVSDGVWLGIAHQMRWELGRKIYWHTWYTVTDRGTMLAKSPAMKLSKCGIEFAAGLAVDRDRDLLVVSYGTEDQDSWLGIGNLSDVLLLLMPHAKEDGIQLHRYR